MPIFVVTTSSLPGRALEMLGGAGEIRVAGTERLEREALLDLVAGAEVVVTMLYDRVDEEFLDAAGPDLGAVCNVAVGFDNIDLAACARRGVIVTNTPGVLDDATADLAFALILAATRRVGEGERLIRAGKALDRGMDFMLGHDLRSARLGIVGLGGIGARVATRGRAFGMEIAYSSRNESPHAVALGAIRLDLDELLATSDVLSLHAPLTEATRHLIGARELGLMKPTATLVNTARGAVVDEAALAAALRDGESPPPATTSSSTSPRSTRLCSTWRTWCWSRISAPRPTRPATRWLTGRPQRHRDRPRPGPAVPVPLPAAD